MSENGVDLDEIIPGGTWASDAQKYVHPPKLSGQLALNGGCTPKCPLKTTEGSKDVLCLN